MKKSICLLLCVLMLLGSAVLAGAEGTADTHVSGCECAECAGNKDISDITYVPPSVGETTTKRSDAIDDAVSKYIKDDLQDVGKELGKKMNAAEKIMQFFHDMCQKLADFAKELSDRFRNLIKR